MLFLPQFIVATLALTKVVVAGSTTPVIAQYWPAYSSDQQSPAQLSSWKSTSIMFYFVTVTTATGMELPADQSTKDIKSFVATARANHVTPVFTLGGWTGSRYFSTLAASAKSRKKLASDLFAFNEKYGFGGVDIDWEHPTQEGIGCNSPSPDDTANFLLLLKEIRAVFGNKSLIMASVSTTGFTGPDGEPLKDASPFAKVLDLLSIMAYDVSGSWSETTGPLAPLRSCSSGVGVDSAIEAWTGAHFPASQILLGIPSYAISFTTTSSQLTNTTIDGYQSQLYSPKTSGTPQGNPLVDLPSQAGVDVCGNPTAAGGYSGQWGMKELIAQGLLGADEQKGGKGYSRIWDDCTATPFLFNSESKTLISYDDSRSVRMKAEYAMSKGLAGAMVFDTLGFTDKVYGALRKGLGRSANSPAVPPSSFSPVKTTKTANSHHSTAHAHSHTISKHPSKTQSPVPSSAISSCSQPLAGAVKLSPVVSSPSPSPSSSIPTTSKLASQAFIRCTSPTSWSLCASDSDCTPMGSVAEGTQCKDGELVWAGKREKREMKSRWQSFGEVRHPRSGVSERR